MIVPGAVLELNASYVYGGQPGFNSPLTTLWSDLSGSANDATLVGFAGNSKSGWGGSGSKIDPSCCVFDGIQDYITVPELNLCSNGSFSYEVVFCLDNLPLVSIPGTLFSESANGIEYSSLAITGTGRLSYSWQYNGRRNYITLLSDSNVCDGLWHCCAVTYDVDTSIISLYLDGIMVDSGMFSPGTQEMFYTTIGSFCYGSPGSNESYLLGSISNVLIYPFTLTESQVLSSYFNTVILNRFDVHCILEGLPSSVSVYIDDGLTIPASLYDLDGNNIGNQMFPDSHNFISFNSDKYYENLWIDAGDGYPQPIESSFVSVGVDVAPGWLSGSGVPSNDTGETGDFYLDTNIGDVYQYQSSGWAFLLNLVGPAVTTATWASVTGKPTFGTAAALNVGTGVGNVARGDCPAVTTSFIQGLGGIIGHGCKNIFLASPADVTQYATGEFSIIYFDSSYFVSDSITSILSVGDILIDISS